MSTMDLHERLRVTVGKHTYKKVGELTDTHPETVRRYLQGQTPSVEFLTNLCRAMGVNPSWLLAGHGPMRLSEIRRYALKEADASELLAAMADTIAALASRVERLEIHSQSLETQIRGLLGKPEPADPAVEVTRRSGVERAGPDTPKPGQSGAERIGAAAKRPSADADRADDPGGA